MFANPIDTKEQTEPPVDANLQMYERLSNERKLLQERGDLPSWYTTPGWQMFKEKYAFNGEAAVRGRHRTIAKTLSRHLKGREAEWEEKFFNELWAGILSPASPALSNTGTDRGMPVSCSGQLVGDAVDSFYSNLRETALLSKYGFGTSADFSQIRPRGAPISTGGTASGPVDVVNDFFTAASKISQGGIRRGSVGAYLNIEHPDWDEACDQLAADPDGKNYGWIIKDTFVERLKAGEEDASRRWIKALYTKLITGKGYIFCVDKANRQRPQMYKDHGLEIVASNLCLTGDTEITVRSNDVEQTIQLDLFVARFEMGYYPSVEVKSYSTKRNEIVWSVVSAAAQTALVEELYEIETLDEHAVRCTGNHKVYTKNRGYVEAQHLVETDELLTTALTDYDWIVQIRKIEVEKTPVYDITVPETECFFANGVLVHNCQEIMLHSSLEYTYSCILASLNLFHWDRIKNSDSAFVATVFLDCLCSEFIKISEGIAGLEKVRNFTIKGRAIGLGVMGFHTYLQSKNIPYIGLEAQFLSGEIAKHLHDESLRASKWLAEEYGEPDWCKGYGVRNTHRTAYAPTKTTALLMGGVSESWFPDPGAVFDAGSSVGELRRITPIIYEVMKSKGVYTPETIKDIIDNLGSVQHVDWLAAEEKLVFLNAFEMDQKVIFRHATQRQKYTCQGQSLNFYVPEDGSEDLIAELMSMVLLDENCLSQYYIYSRSGVIIKDECVSCSA